MSNIIKGKKVLITAGPVWVKIDSIRVMTNISSGAMGYTIAEEATKMGADVTLILGPGKVQPTGKEKFKIIPFKYFDELYAAMESEISTKKYIAVFHSCAVPDWMPKTEVKGKIKSGKGELVLKFKPTVKIVDQIKKWDENIFLCKFKFESDVSVDKLLEIARESMEHSKANLIIANRREDVHNGEHTAYIMNAKTMFVAAHKSKKTIAKAMLESLY